MSNSLPSTTRLTFITELCTCTWLNLWVRHSASVIDLTTFYDQWSPMPEIWDVTGSVVFTRFSRHCIRSSTLSSWSSSTASSSANLFWSCLWSTMAQWYVLNSMLKASSFLNILDSVCCSFSVKVSFSSNWTSFVYRWVMLPTPFLNSSAHLSFLTLTWYIPIGTQSLACYYLVRGTNDHTLMVLFYFTCFTHIGSLFIRFASIEFHPIKSFKSALWQFNIHNRAFAGYM